MNSRERLKSKLRYKLSISVSLNVFTAESGPMNFNTVKCIADFIRSYNE